MKTKLDIAIERIMDIISDIDPTIYETDKHNKLYKEINWEIVTAIKEMTLEEIATHFEI